MKLEDRVERTEKRVKTVEDAVVLLTVLTDSHDDRLERFLFGLEELKTGQREMQEKINILIDSQIRSEDKMAEMAEAIKSAHNKIDKIEEK